MNSNDEQDQSLEEQFFGDQLGELERRKLLEEAGRVAAEIAIDLTESGPLGRYVQSRRLEAAEALRLLVDADPRDAIAIMSAQSTVREYLRVCSWVSARIDDGDEAGKIIERDYHGHGRHAADQDQE